MKIPCVYIIANKPRGIVYTGVTSNLPQRIWQHKHGVVSGFSRRYGLHTLVYYEVHEEMESAIMREKAIKRWRRLWKDELIEQQNPEWRDLYDEITGDGPI